MRIELPAPRTFPEPVDPEVFEIVRAEHRRISKMNGETVSANIRLNPRTSSYYQDIATRIRPLIKQAFSPDSRLKILYLDIAVASKTEPGQPFVSPWASRWHADPPRHPAATGEVLMASTQPTETLAGEIEDERIHALYPQKDLEALANSCTDTELTAQYGLTILTPLPNIMSLFSPATEHRTALNQLEVPVDRELLAAGIAF